MSVTPVPPTGASRRPLLQADIETAQRLTASAAGAARYLNVDYTTYKKWARYYGIFERHKNQAGRGLNRKRSKGKYGLDSILNGEHPTYNRTRLKERLIRAGYLAEECGLCGYNQRRIVDGRCPLSLYCLDGDFTNLRRENLQLRCFNCIYLTTGIIASSKLLHPGSYHHDLMTAANMNHEDMLKLRDEIMDEEIR